MVSIRIDNELSERNTINVRIQHSMSHTFYCIYINDIHIALTNLNINYNCILFANYR